MVIPLLVSLVVALLATVGTTYYCISEGLSQLDENRGVAIFLFTFPVVYVWLLILGVVGFLVKGGSRDV